MKTVSVRVCFFLFAVFSFLFPACKSAEPAFNQSPTPAFSREPPPDSRNSETAPESTKPTETLPKTTPKLHPDTTKTLSPANRTETTFSDDDEDAEPQNNLSQQEIKIEKIRRKEKEKGKWLSGSFVGSGMVLLIAALVMVIIGSGPAGLVAIIGGILFLIGFILSMLALLGR